MTVAETLQTFAKARNMARAASRILDDNREGAQDLRLDQAEWHLMKALEHVKALKEADLTE